MKKAGILLLCLLMPMATAFAEQNKPLSVDVLWQLNRIGSPIISPSGDRIIAPVTQYDVPEDKGSTQLWLFDKEGSTQRALTAKGLRVSEPTFSPDGNTLAFISKRDEDEAGQVYLLPMNGPGEAQKLTDVPGGVYGMKWVGKHIYFISRIFPGKNWDEMTTQLKADKDNKVSAHQWNELPYSSFDHWIDEDRQAHVFRIPATGGEIEAITQPLKQQLPRSSQSASSYDIDLNEQWIAFTANGWDASLKSREVDPKIDIFLAKIGSNKAENLTPDNEAPNSNPQFSPNGKTLAFTQQLIHGFYADTSRLVLMDMKKRQPKVINDTWDRSVSRFGWTKDSKGFYAAIDDAATSRIYHIDAKNGKVKAITKQTNFGKPVMAKDGTIVTTNDSFLYPARLVTINPRNGKTTRLDSFNDDILAEVDMGTYESVTYKGYNDQDIQMWVHYPPGFDRSKKYPLMMLIHGGPHSAITDGFHYRWNAQTFASWGYVTAWPNFHGSSGFGQEFADSINPDWKNKSLEDVFKATDWFEDKEWIDSERMVAGGASYGGYLSSIILGQEHPFNALLIHAAVYNMYSQMAADFSVHSTRFGSYWDKPEIYKAISPHYFAENFNTPTLVIHGQLDYRVPVGQGFELFRTLQTRGVESKMIYFPDENHWIMKPNNSIYWYNQVEDWMTRFAEPGGR
ncbi:peptidase S9 prolyl oligopeptidase active site domain protein [Shewanella halifaxensis HAW-EB4]|uniref:Acyl-peptide hydrolase n=1 Tax=Shewanella halifaxensis (strain HAW-EB4) TaxID=458817 RepID=B0TT96_SHEHH|nr:S9 family peptidase [Shewanella halifaxensis]ABZ78037.1 peptidase S9 prolyl oligopeptidase active site domain protein [Shewanella halifaxensis HAW-EB4]